MFSSLGVFNGNYHARMRALFGSSMIGYYIGDEPSGAVATDYSGLAFNGAYTGVTLGQPGIGDGLTCPLYDGANDFTQPPAGFRSAFNGAEGTVFGHSKFTGAVWADGVVRDLFNFQADANNRVRITKGITLDQIGFNYTAGGTVEFFISTILAGTLDFFYWAITWSKSGEIVVGYLNRASAGSATALGIWVGTPAAATTIIGALNSTPVEVTDGLIAHVGVLNRAATPAEMAAAAVI